LDAVILTEIHIHTDLQLDNCNCRLQILISCHIPKFHSGSNQEMIAIMPYIVS